MFTLKKLILTALTILVITIGGLYVFHLTENEQSNRPPDPTDSTEPKTESESQEVEKHGQVKPKNGVPRYTSEYFQLSFDLPPEMRVGELEEGEGWQILAQDQQKIGRSFQIFITEWPKQEEVMTPEIIKNDLPEIIIQEPEYLKMTGGRQALTFISELEGLGPTREVWFVYQGHLYQLNIKLEHQDLLSKVLDSWQFSS